MNDLFSLAGKNILITGSAQGTDESPNDFYQNH
ncbi:hypothetical protein ECET_23075 [Escherichia coli]|nr:hypothetical protein ECET_23075 [Escherichia coli]